MRERRFKKPLRYKGHDYRAPCSVHITICTWRHQHLFGYLSAEGVELTPSGRFTESALLALHEPADGVEIDTHIIMPDHLHAIIHLGTRPGMTSAVSISHLVRSFKMRVFKAWPGGVRHHGWSLYDTHLWQQSYYDTLIRNDAHLETTRRYILANPDRWIEKHGP